MEEKQKKITKPYLTFKLGDEIFALEIRKVHEVLEMTQITKIPQSPEYMKGVINLRGGVVTVVDLRLKFGMPAAETTVDTSIIILELKYQNTPVILGVVVDSVKEVLELDVENIESAPKIGMNVANEYIQGIGKSGGLFLIILDMDRIFSTAELTYVKGMNSGQQGE